MAAWAPVLSAVPGVRLGEIEQGLGLELGAWRSPWRNQAFATHEATFSRRIATARSLRCVEA
jgi:hypothetical protein